MLYAKKLFIALGFLASISGISADDPLVRNGDFTELNPKQMPAVWYKGFPEKQGTWSIDDKVFNSPPHSLCITNTDPDQYSLYSQKITLTPGTDYKLSFWMKGENITSDNPKNGAYIYIDDAKTQNIVIDGTFNGKWKKATGNFDWQKVDLLFNSGKTAEARIGLVLYKANGKAWFDSIRLEAVAAVKNSSEIFTSDLFPVNYQKASYSLAGNFPGVLSFSCKGDKSKAGDLKLIFELPDECELIGAAWFFPSAKDVDGSSVYAQEKVTAEKITADGKNHTRYAVSLNKGFINQLNPASLAWNNYERIYIRKNKPSNTEKATVSWYLSNDTWKSETKKFDLYYLPAIKNNPAPAKKFESMICYMNSTTAPFEDVRNEYLNYWTSLSSINHTLDIFGWNNLSGDLRKKITDKFKVDLFLASKHATPYMGFDRWRKDSCAKNSEAEIPLLIMDNGKEIPDAACPSYIASSSFTAPYWSDYVANKISEKMKFCNGNRIIYDVEPGAMNHCFCQTCQKEFKKFIEPEDFSDIKEIKKKYAAKWFDFRVAQNNVLISRLAEFLKTRFPKKEFWLCTDPVHTKQTLSEWCGVDARLADKYVDGHMNMPYYEGLQFYDDMKLNMASLKKANIPLVDPTEMDEMFYIRYTPEGVAQNIIASAALGCKGFGFWPFDFFDGRYLEPVSRAFASVSKAEDYYFSDEKVSDLSAGAVNIYSQEFTDEGRKITATFPDFAETLKIHFNQKGTARLVTLINYNKKFAAIAKIQMSSADDVEYNMTELDSGKIHSSEKGKSTISGKALKEGVLTEIPAGSYKVVELSPRIAATGIKNQEEVILQETLRTKLTAESARIASLCQFSEKKSADGKASISWGDPDKNKVPELKLSNGINCAYVSTDKAGGIISWREKSASVSDDFIADKNYSGIIGNIVFYDDKNAANRNNYSIKTMEIDKNNCPLVTLFHKIEPEQSANAESTESAPIDGVEITKDVRLEKDGSVLTVKFSIKNASLSGKAIKTGFRIKNYPFTGSALSGNEPPVKISTVSTTVNGTEQVVSGNFKTNNIFLAAGNSSLGFAGQIDTKPIDWTVSPVKITATEGNHKRILSITPDMKNTAGFYVWWSPTSGFTIELLSREFTIPFGDTITYECSYRIEKQ